MTVAVFIGFGFHISFLLYPLKRITMTEMVCFHKGHPVGAGGGSGAEERRSRKSAGSSWRAEKARPRPMKAQICPYLVFITFTFLGPFESGEFIESVLA